MIPILCMALTLAERLGSLTCRISSLSFIAPCPPILLFVTSMCSSFRAAFSADAAASPARSLSTDKITNPPGWKAGANSRDHVTWRTSTSSP